MHFTRVRCCSLSRVSPIYYPSPGSHTWITLRALYWVLLPADSSIFQFYTAKSAWHAISSNKAGRNQKTNKKIFHCLVNALSEKHCPRPKAWNSRTCTTGFNSPEQKSRLIKKRSWNLVSVTNLTGACDEGTEPLRPCLLILPVIWTPYRTRVVQLYLPKHYFLHAVFLLPDCFIVEWHKKSLF